MKRFCIIFVLCGCLLPTLQIEKKDLKAQERALKQRRKELKKTEKATQKKDLAAYEQLKLDQIALAEAWYQWEVKKKQAKSEKATSKSEK